MDEPLQKGDLVGGRYQIVRRIGSGAGGRIFLALDRHLGNRETAIKFYEPDALIQDLSEHVRSGIITRDVYDNELSNIYQRFRQEAIGISRLDHAAIVRVYDYQDSEYEVVSETATHNRTQPFLCMEYIEGETLELALTKGRIHRQHALLLGSQIADGLSFAHEHGIVHRDLKPSNIMIEALDTAPKASIIDWGVAKIIEDEAKVTVSRLSQSDDSEDIRTRGLLLGTPKFIAPEHFESGGARWGPASDVFSLGMILFRMLTGHPLRRESYVGECLTSSDIELLSHVCSGQKELVDLVFSCLSEIREDRMSASQVRDRLKELYGENPAGTANGFDLSDLAPNSKSAGESEAFRSMQLEQTQVHDTRAELTDSEVHAHHSFARKPGKKMLLLLASLGGIGLGLLIVNVFPMGGGDIKRDVDEPAIAEERDSPEEAAIEKPVEPVAEPPEEPAFSFTVRLISKPESYVHVKGPSGETELGKTPVELTFTHPSEAQRLVYRPVSPEDRKVYTELEETILVADFLTDGKGDEIREHHVKLYCADITDPACNDYLKKFNRVFEEEE